MGAPRIRPGYLRLNHTCRGPLDRFGKDGPSAQQRPYHLASECPAQEWALPMAVQEILRLELPGDGKIEETDVRITPHSNDSLPREQPETFGRGNCGNLHESLERHATAEISLLEQHVECGLCP